jgi:hypothetical protein
MITLTSFRQRTRFSTLLLILVLVGACNLMGQTVAATISSATRTSGESLTLGQSASFTADLVRGSSDIAAILFYIEDQSGFSRTAVKVGTATTLSAAVIVDAGWLNGDYTIERILVQDSAGRFTRYYRDGSVAISDGSASAPSSHSISFTDLDFSISGGVGTESNAPIILSYPGSITTVAGGSISIDIRVSTVNQSPVTWVAKFSNRTLTPSATAVVQAGNSITASLAFGPISPADAGSLPISLVVTVPDSPPEITLHPKSHSVEVGSSAAFGVTLSGTTPFLFQWIRDGQDITSGTGTELIIPTVTLNDAGEYSVRVSNAVGSVTSQTGKLTVVLSGEKVAAHELMGPGYLPGKVVGIRNSISYPGNEASLEWTVVFPEKWLFVSDTTTGAIVRPQLNASGAITWRWDSIQNSPHQFTYFLRVPSDQNSAAEIIGLVDLSISGLDYDLLATPDPLIVPISVSEPHSADVNGDFRLSLSELLRVIELYNTRNGTVRTGSYSVDSETEDKFTTDPTRPSGSNWLPGLFHSADTSKDGRLGLSELLRVIEHYNTRDGTVRAGGYEPKNGTIDGFAPRSW